MVYPHVKLDDVPAVYAALKAAGLHASNAGMGSDIIACPGLDYCNLSNARSISVANEIQAVFADPEFEDEVGTLHVNVSGCINACGHHHVGHIGILGVDKKGEEFYQVLFGGRADEKATIATIQGPGLQARGSRAGDPPRDRRICRCAASRPRSSSTRWAASARPRSRRRCMPLLKDGKIDRRYLGVRGGRA